MNSPAAPPLVAVQLPADAGWLAAVRSIWADGAAVLPLDPALPEAATQAALEQLRPGRLLTPEGHRSLPGARPVPAGTGVVVATSGSTAAPKGVMLSHDALRASVTASLRRLDATAADRWLCCLPVQHVAGLQVLLRSAELGNEPIIQPRFDVTAVASERSATLVSLVPTMLRRLLDAQADLGHLRCILLGGAPPGRRLLADAAAVGLHVVTTYGMTETCGGSVYDGVPLDGVEIDVDAAGTIGVRGSVLFTGYRTPSADVPPQLDGAWWRTADLGRLVDGRLEILGRSDDVIITGGHNVVAGRVADLLEEHPGVAEAAVIGVDDPEWGQRVVAYVVPRGIPPSLDDLRAFVTQNAPAYLAPREVVVLDALPRLTSGKVDRRRLR